MFSLAPLYRVPNVGGRLLSEGAEGDAAGERDRGERRAATWLTSAAASSSPSDRALVGVTRGVMLLSGLKASALSHGKRPRRSAADTRRSQASDPAGQLEALGHTRAFPLSVNDGLGGGTLSRQARGQRLARPKRWLIGGCVLTRWTQAGYLPDSYGGVCEYGVR